MLTCIVLGMGVPTTANYIIMATTCAPILVNGMGINPIAANMFVFYFGIVADITPPVALAAYAGSAIAKSNPMKTAFNASRLAIAAFVVPYIFALNPAMLFINAGVLDVALIVVTSLIGLFGIAGGLEGYMFNNMNVVQRLMAVIGGLCMMIPGTMTDIIGVVLVGASCAWQMAEKKKKAIA
ncbi:MAG: TRAP transporter large permease subunit, partial [Lachnoclostridium sp.]|nr:TRAP transporter large permease subunit [Lachnoclostridium sp.]